jgi:hypothetical protein
MLTIFSTPKPFVGHSNIIQRNAIKSWTLLHPDIEIILFGDEEGAADVCSEFGIRHEPEVLRNEHGMKVLSSLFERAQHVARYKYLCYCNCDIMLTSDFRRAYHRVVSWKTRFLLVGQRWDISLAEPWDFETADWEQRLMRLVERSGEQRSPDWIDYFLFPRGLYTDIPPLVIGRVHWDQWLIWKARSVNAAVVNASAVMKAVHQNHDYGYHPAGAQGVWSDEQAVRNYQVAGGDGHLYSMKEATHILTSERVRYNWFYRRPASKLAIRAGCVRPWYWFLGLTGPIRHRLGLRKGFLARAMRKDARPGV